jgi:hypothetical protein
MKLKSLTTILVALGLSALLSTTALAGNKKLMTVAAAKVTAERAIVESVIGMKIRATEEVQDMVGQDFRIQAKTQSAIKGITYEDIVYDKEKDIAKVVAAIKVGKVSNIVGRNIDYGTMVIRRVGFATSTPDNAGPLQALRAAELDAYKELGKKIVGFKLRSNTTVENFILKNDTIQTKMMAAIYGAQLVSYRWDEDGDAYVTLRIAVSQVEDVLAQRLDYQGQYIEVEGSGAQKDDFAEAQQQATEQNYTSSSSQVKEGTLGIPIANQPQAELKGEAIQEAPKYDTGGAYNLQ